MILNPPPPTHRALVQGVSLSACQHLELTSCTRLFLCCRGNPLTLLVLNELLCLDSGFKQLQS